MLAVIIVKTFQMRQLKVASLELLKKVLTST